MVRTRGVDFPFIAPVVLLGLVTASLCSLLTAYAPAFNILTHANQLACFATVRTRGVEPPRACAHIPLKDACLPVPPRPRKYSMHDLMSLFKNIKEVYSFYYKKYLQEEI